MINQTAKGQGPDKERGRQASHNSPTYENWRLDPMVSVLAPGVGDRALSTNLSSAVVGYSHKIPLCGTPGCSDTRDRVPSDQCDSGISLIFIEWGEKTDSY